MQFAIDPGPCYYCGKPIGVIMPYTGEGVLVIRSRKLLGVAHKVCFGRAEQQGGPQAQAKGRSNQNDQR